jgi:hypothetical protein
MKTFLILLLFLIAHQLCFAQRVTYNDLNYVYYHNIDQVEEYLSTKGFDYKGADTSSEENRIYSSNFAKNPASYNEISVSKTSIDGKALGASFSTYLKSDYIAFKANIKRIGYSFASSTTGKNGSLYLNYTKGKMFIQFNLSTVPSKRNLYIISFGDASQ